MKVLIVGSGGREHAIAWSVSKSPKVDKIYCAPGNAGIAELAECVDIGAMEFEKLADFAQEKEIDLTIIGMDDPLVGGVVDAFEAEGLRVFGPRKNAAIIEGSKAFSKDLMKKYNIPTAGYENFDSDEAALAYLETAKFPIVLKADGLALGKGVLICNTLEEAKDLAILLRSGALPVKVSVLEVRTVGPSLGQDSKDKSVVAFAIGLSLVVFFMLAVYRISGFVADTALLVYVLILLGILYVLHATLTLPSIAGIILSIGMAVDANVLIFERFKEEIASGKLLRLAVQSGFKRAFVTIFDANMTVIITSCILFFLGSATVKGFAFSLGLGVAVSMFTAITVSRTLLMLLINANWIHNPWWFGGKKGDEANV